MKEQRLQARWIARERRHATETEGGEAVAPTPEETAAAAAAAKVKANRASFGEFLSTKRSKKH